MKTIRCTRDAASYYRGCRCLTCREAKRERVARNRQRARDRAFTGLAHGSSSAWDAGCRCAPCKSTHDARDAAYERRAQPVQYGRCPVCRYVRALRRRDGMMRKHGNCTGAGFAPVGRAT